jgi:hypothetical protein
MADSWGNQSAQGGGCLALFLVVLIVTAIVEAVISLAALDPFNWMPRIGDIWAD